jgi:hypothetical protein
MKYQKAQPDIAESSLLLDLSPNAKKELADATYQDLRRGMVFWQKYTGQNSQVRMVFADRQDLDWFVETMKSIQPGNQSWIPRIYDLAKSGPIDQYGGSNGGDLQGRSLFFFLPGTTTKSTSSGWLGVGPHEWTHHAQYQMAGNTDLFPCWFKEGQATYFGNAISNSDLNNWAKHWRGEIQTIQYSFPQFKTISYQDLQTWFTNHELNMPNGVCGPDGAFMIGGIAVEYLVGTMGVDDTNNFLLQIKKGVTWKVALEKLSGKTSEQLMNDLVAYVLKVRDWTYQ